MSSLMKSSVRGNRISNRGQPAWEIAFLYPEQGKWSEDEYLCLDRTGGRLIELSDGCLEVLPMPTPAHQRIVKVIHRQLDDFVMERGLGEVYFAPLPVHLKAGVYREPDIVFLSTKRAARIGDYPKGADLVVEVVSDGESNRKRDLEIKRREYASAGIAEYWIVDPAEKTVLVLRLRGKQYREAGRYSVGEIAKSERLDGFELVVKTVFTNGKTVRKEKK